MPLYTYHCKDCAKLFELIVKLEDVDKEIKCPSCGKTLKKQMDAPYFVMR